MSVPHDADSRTAFSRKSGSSAAAVQSADRYLYVVVQRSGTTILPGSGRPTGRLGGSICRHSAKYERTHNYMNINANIEPNDAAKNVWNND